MSEPEPSISAVRFTRTGALPELPQNVAVARVAVAALQAAKDHPEIEPILVMVLAADTTTGESIVVSGNIDVGARASFLTMMLRAELKGSGQTVKLVPDRPQG